MSGVRTFVDEERNARVVSIDYDECNVKGDIVAELCPDKEVEEDKSSVD